VDSKNDVVKRPVGGLTVGESNQSGEARLTRPHSPSEVIASLVHVRDAKRVEHLRELNEGTLYLRDEEGNRASSAALPCDLREGTQGFGGVVTWPRRSLPRASLYRYYHLESVFSGI